MIRLGYAGVNTELPTASKTFRLAGYSEERMLEVSRGNILALEDILHWNEEHGIFLFRITSNLIPFGSHPVNSGSWKQAFRKDFQRIGSSIRSRGMRVSLHPGQHTVLNTPNEAVFASVLRDLEYHEAILGLLGLGPGHVIVIHGGGAYGDKESALAVLVSRISGLPQHIRGRLALENDERIFTAEDVLSVCRETGLPGILDVFHHEVLPSFNGLDVRDIIERFGETWRGMRQKIHYSEQAQGKRPGSHARDIGVASFGAFLHAIRGLDLDVMIEAKNKQATVLALREAYPHLA